MIFIRLVSGGKNNHSRFQIAFDNVSNDKWNLFSNANELPEKLYDDEHSIDEDMDYTILNSAVQLSTYVLHVILAMLSNLLLMITYIPTMNIY